MFANDSLCNELFEGQNLSDKIKMIFEASIPTGMDGYELFAFNRIYMNKILGDESNLLKQSTLYRKVDNHIEPVNYLEWQDKRTGEYIGRFFGSSLGQFQFTSINEAIKFKNSIEWVK